MVSEKYILKLQCDIAAGIGGKYCSWILIKFKPDRARSAFCALLAVKLLGNVWHAVLRVPFRKGCGGQQCLADSFRATWPFGIYNSTDYAGETHPPFIGFDAG